MATRYSSRLRKRKCVEEISPILALPAEIFIDIFLSLPVETIMQCRSVCKTWRDLLSTPYFAHLHFSKAQPRSLLFFCPCSGIKTSKKSKRFYCDIHSRRSSNINDATVSTPAKLNLLKFTDHGEVVGSSNGLLCISEIVRKNKLYICNPLTGEYVEIPGPEVEKGWHASKPIEFFYSPQKNQYKILMYRERKGHGFQKSGQIFTLGSNSWRNIDIPEHRKLHTAKRYISSFDMENEQARSIAVPDHIDLSTACLVVLGNFLCLYDNGYPQFSIWLMKEYGVEEFWKHYVVQRSPNSHYRPITVKEDGSILMKHNSTTLISYEPETKKSRALYQFGPTGVVLHTPSFVSLKDLLIGGCCKVLNVRDRKRRSTINILEF
ncbi:unnamed protein product [Dovyalis caffra]|uniref:F-box domain-containing protein n=1 Tax=Dovyalis caffra TaxID=77055 RepID=A0AAV1RAW7_9ROSI|nr:unnamed protein product [Dovyalis caffra]